MKSRLHILYLPGLGDQHDTGQKFAIGLWRLWGVEPEFFPMNWSATEPWGRKQTRLLARIDALTASGKRIGLVGASAGAAATIIAYARRKTQIVGCVLIAGKVHNAKSLSQKYRQENPALFTAVQECEEALKDLARNDRQRILSRYGLIDGVVPGRDSFITGARNRTLSSFGHSTTIAIQLVFGAPNFLHFLKSL